MVIIGPVFAVIIQPMLLRAGLTQDFAQAFQIEWIKDFLRRVWLEVILGLLFLVLAKMVLGCVGFLACCVGVLAAGPIMGAGRRPILCIRCIRFTYRAAAYRFRSSWPRRR